MYLNHYNLSEKPFQITTDPKFLWLGEKHQEALATLRYGVLDSRGFLLLTGDVGTGKTTLINALLRDLDDSVVTATVVDPSLDKLEFFRLLARAFGFHDKFTKKVDFLTDFAGFLNRAYEDDRKVLLIIDEAQRLSAELLEEIRLLSNIEKEDRKLLNIFFVGQDEFKKTLMHEDSRALRQRIAITYQINPLVLKETAEYIKYRLKIAGSRAEMFDRRAVRDIYTFSRGYPRLINILCDHALLTGFVREVKTIGSAIIKECAQELSVPGATREPVPVKEEQVPPRKKIAKKHLLRIGVYAFLLLLIGFSGYLSTALGPTDYVQNVGNFYRGIFGSPRGRSSQPQDWKIHAADSKQVSTSRSLQRNDMPENNTVSVTSDPQNQGAPPRIHQEKRYNAAVTGTETAHTGRAISERKITHDVGPIPAARAVEDSGQAGVQPVCPPSVEAELLLFSHGKLVVPFYYDRVELPEKTFSVLDRLAALMVWKPSIEIVVTGHTDSTGDPYYNKMLSELRANAVKAYLVGKGIGPSRVKTVGLGDRNPAKPNKTAAGRRANRRAEIELQTARRQ